jgi:hypothetical protein
LSLPEAQPTASCLALWSASLRVTSLPVPGLGLPPDPRQRWASRLLDRLGREASVVADLQLLHQEELVFLVQVALAISSRLHRASQRALRESLFPAPPLPAMCHLQGSRLSSEPLGRGAQAAAQALVGC